MKQFLETKNNYLIGVATDNWRERIECGLPRDVEDIYWYDNVYEATAAAVNLSQKNKPILLTVMIDCLSREEMGVFATLAGMDKVQTTAVSGTGNQLKMRQAETLGADRTVLLSELSQPGTIEKPFVAKAESPVTETEPLDIDGLPKKIAQEHPSEIQKGATLPKNISELAPLRQAPQSSPRRKPPIIEREENQPLLTPEELDALLG
ncbi:MAG: hypothetical protein KAJ46_00365 [Sedimentisphaerales bacterium]|nr:hypothetical protein [Sedimentisphaerales bacterium]